MGAPSPRPNPPDDLEATLTRVAPTVLAWCRRLGAGQVDADEAAQEVLWVVAQRLPGLDRGTALEPWIYAVTRNIVRRHARRVWWRRWVGGDVERVSTARSAEDALAGAELAALMDRAMVRLNPAQREVIVLCLVEERSEAEVAALLGVPLGTVKSRMRLARAAFRRELRAREELAPLRRHLEDDDGA